MMEPMGGHCFVRLKIKIQAWPAMVFVNMNRRFPGKVKRGTGRTSTIVSRGNILDSKMTIFANAPGKPRHASECRQDKGKQENKAIQFITYTTHNLRSVTYL